jgi:hypothetical protein
VWASILAILFFTGSQIGHPRLDVTSVDTVEWVIRNTGKMVFAALARRTDSHRQHEHRVALGRLESSPSRIFTRT